MALVDKESIRIIEMEELIELIKSIENRCAVVKLLYDMPGRVNLIPTILEDIYEDAELIIERFCLEEKNGST